MLNGILTLPVFKMTWATLTEAFLGTFLLLHFAFPATELSRPKTSAFSTPAPSFPEESFRLFLLIQIYQDSGRKRTFIKQISPYKTFATRKK